MSLQIYFTPRSKETFKSTYNFIKNEFGASVAEKFSIKTEKTIKLIADHPLMFKVSTIATDVRVGLITKQCSVFYRVTDTTIHLLFFWDNRQEPL
ncbi:type II toxin-antitoxin system RelE/ParE family toxin [Mucilaginibacter sp. AK015]|uniref:type II toxin-antitoxin system RelE/ParE family toxin n=1 Tax=Mucilaginibacter sp. AK015 TaxID=2723072 RepID=UPI0016143C2B|nr:type II toxin-antitoxin system RelE/ParE family toxin [Mucilaginibacter sp. AK015]MBB5395777.1 plasmid stabilization system protein ParE [Mucilaginibacter sp. AK015]